MLEEDIARKICFKKTFYCQGFFLIFFLLRLDQLCFVWSTNNMTDSYVKAWLFEIHFFFFQKKKKHWIVFNLFRFHSFALFFLRCFLQGCASSEIFPFFIDSQIVGQVKRVQQRCKVSNTLKAPMFADDALGLMNRGFLFIYVLIYWLALFLQRTNFFSILASCVALVSLIVFFVLFLF